MDEKQEKKLKWQPFALSGFIVFMVLILIFSIYYSENCGVHPGQEWVEVTNADDPFQAAKVKKYTVIAVANGYVKWEREDDIFKYTGSSKISYFKIGSELIEKP